MLSLTFLLIFQFWYDLTWIVKFMTLEDEINYDALLVYNFLYFQPNTNHHLYDFIGIYD